MSITCENKRDVISSEKVVAVLKIKNWRDYIDLRPEAYQLITIRLIVGNKIAWPNHQKYSRQDSTVF